MAPLEVVHAYRHLYRGLLRAVHYSTPARHTIRIQIRRAFRNPANTLDPAAVKRTIWFLNAAAKERGMEHAILKNLLTMAWHRDEYSKLGGSPWKAYMNKLKFKVDERDKMMKEVAYSHFDNTLAMMNKTMGMCLYWTKAG